MAYQANPQRGCGTKKADSTYAEGGSFSSGGALHPFSWILGDGMEHGTNLLIGQAPMGMTWFNPAATLTRGELVWADAEFVPQTDTEAELYEHYKTKTRTVGLLDHVGSSHYTAYEFYDEVTEYGPSRKIPKKFAGMIAKVINKMGPVPIWFTHSDLPLFREDPQQWAVLDAIKGVMSEDPDWLNKNFEPTWLHENWGQYARGNQYQGNDHYLRLVTSYVSAVKGRDRDTPAWGDLIDAIGKAPMVEQVFGASWICKISYTLKDDGTADEDVLSIPGLNIIDLNED